MWYKNGMLLILFYTTFITTQVFSAALPGSLYPSDGSQDNNLEDGKTKVKIKDNLNDSQVQCTEITPVDLQTAQANPTWKDIECVGPNESGGYECDHLGEENYSEPIYDKVGENIRKVRKPKGSIRRLDTKKPDKYYTRIYYYPPKPVMVCTYKADRIDSDIIPNLLDQSLSNLPQRPNQNFSIGLNEKPSQYPNNDIQAENKEQRPTTQQGNWKDDDLNPQNQTQKSFGQPENPDDNKNRSLPSEDHPENIQKPKPETTLNPTYGGTPVDHQPLPKTIQPPSKDNELQGNRNPTSNSPSDIKTDDLLNGGYPSNRKPPENIDSENKDLLNGGKGKTPNAFDDSENKLNPQTNVGAGKKGDWEPQHLRPTGPSIKDESVRVDNQTSSPRDDNKVPVSPAKTMESPTDRPDSPSVEHPTNPTLQSDSSGNPQVNKKNPPLNENDQAGKNQGIHNNQNGSPRDKGVIPEKPNQESDGQLENPDDNRNRSLPSTKHPEHIQEPKPELAINPTNGVTNVDDKHLPKKINSPNNNNESQGNNISTSNNPSDIKADDILSRKDLFNPNKPEKIDSEKKGLLNSGKEKPLNVLDGSENKLNPQTSTVALEKGDEKQHLRPIRSINTDGGEGIENQTSSARDNNKIPVYPEKTIESPKDSQIFPSGGDNSNGGPREREINSENPNKESDGKHENPDDNKNRSLQSENHPENIQKPKPETTLNPTYGGTPVDHQPLPKTIQSPSKDNEFQGNKNPTGNNPSDIKTDDLLNRGYPSNRKAPDNIDSEKKSLINSGNGKLPNAFDDSENKLNPYTNIGAGKKGDWEPQYIRPTGPSIKDESVRVDNQTSSPRDNSKVPVSPAKTMESPTDRPDSPSVEHPTNPTLQSDSSGNPQVNKKNPPLNENDQVRKNQGVHNNQNGSPRDKGVIPEKLNKESDGQLENLDINKKRSLPTEKHPENIHELKPESVITPTEAAKTVDGNHKEIKSLNDDNTLPANKDPSVTDTLDELKSDSLISRKSLNPKLPDHHDSKTETPTNGGNGNVPNSFGRSQNNLNTPPSSAPSNANNSERNHGKPLQPSNSFASEPGKEETTSPSKKNEISSEPDKSTDKSVYNPIVHKGQDLNLQLQSEIPERLSTDEAKKKKLSNKETPKNEEVGKNQRDSKVPVKDLESHPNQKPNNDGSVTESVKPINGMNLPSDNNSPKDHVSSDSNVSTKNPLPSEMKLSPTLSSLHYGQPVTSPPPGKVVSSWKEKHQNTPRGIPERNINENSVQPEKENPSEKRFEPHDLTRESSDRDGIPYIPAFTQVDLSPIYFGVIDDFNPDKSHNLSQPKSPKIPNHRDPLRNDDSIPVEERTQGNVKDLLQTDGKQEGPKNSKSSVPSTKLNPADLQNEKYCPRQGPGENHCTCPCHQRNHKRSSQPEHEHEHLSP